MCVSIHGKPVNNIFDIKKAMREILIAYLFAKSESSMGIASHF